MDEIRTERQPCRTCGHKMYYAWPPKQLTPELEVEADNFQQCRYDKCDERGVVIDVRTGEVWWIRQMDFSTFNAQFRAPEG